MGGLAGNVAARGSAPDLSGFATRHGLTLLGAGHIGGIWIDEDTSDYQNLMHGKLPGGELGALGHNKAVRGHDGGHSGSQTQYRAETRIAARVPEAIGAFQRFEITNSSLFETLALSGDPGRTKVSLNDVGFNGGTGWMMKVADTADQSHLPALLGGEFGAQLKAMSGTFTLHYQYGCLVLAREDGYLAEPDLDLVCEQLCALATSLRAAGLAAASPKQWDAELPAPAWAGGDAPDGPKVKQFMGIRAQFGGGGGASDPVGGLGEPLMEPFRGGIMSIVQARGDALEDPLEFHRAFPSVPLPGRAYAVLRTPLEGGGTCRIVFCTEAMGGGGAAATTCKVKDGTADRDMPLGGGADDIRIAVRDGVMAAWLHRGLPSIDEAFIAMGQQAWEVAKSEGWVPA